VNLIKPKFVITALTLVILIGVNAQEPLRRSAELAASTLSSPLGPATETCPKTAEFGPANELEEWEQAGYANVEIEWLPLSEEGHKLSDFNYPTPTHQFELDVVLLREAGWTQEIIHTRYAKVREVFLRCGIELNQIKLVTVDGPLGLIAQEDHSTIAPQQLLDSSQPRPTSKGTGQIQAVPLQLNQAPVRETVMIESNIVDFNPGEVHSESDFRFGERMPTGDRITNIHVGNVHGNPSISSPEFIFGEGHPLLNTQWIESRVLSDTYASKRNASICTEAHEVGHILLNEGHLESEEPNIMNMNGDLRNDQFSPDQCEKMKEHEKVIPL
jgi:hypothetical protein